MHEAVDQKTLLKKDLIFNIVVGQIIAISLVSGGVFTQNLQNKLNLQIPILQLTFMYFPLMGYLVFWFKKKEEGIPIRYFFLCSLIDIHTTLFIVFSYTYTSITSVMLLEDFTIPSALILSIFFLKI